MLCHQAMISRLRLPEFFAVVTTDGLKLICGVYKHRDQYWMTVQMKTTNAHRPKRPVMVKKNSFGAAARYFTGRCPDGSRNYKSLAGN